MDSALRPDRATAYRARVYRARACRVVCLMLAGLLLAGCGLMPSARHAPLYAPRFPAEPYPKIEATAVASLAAAVNQSTGLGQHGRVVGASRQHSPLPRARPLNILAVSAGGAHCPFAAGALIGWTKSGQRPAFDVVTGTSSGALVGAFAFLGPKYDDQLESLFTTLDTADLFDIRPIGYLWRDGALASPHPLERRLERVFNDQFMNDLRAAHAQGRRLFIGTTNFDTKRLVVWDVGAIASSGDPAADMLVRKIFLASTTWPGLLPPVEFTVQDKNGQWRRERHIDGGAAAQSFVRFPPNIDWPNPGEPAPGWLTGSNLYIVSCGKLYQAATPAPSRFMGRIMSGVSCLTNSLARADMSRLHTLCATSGMKFHLLVMPQDYLGGEDNIMELNVATLRQLFDMGRRRTAAGPPWRLTPPDVEPGEEDSPRGAMREAGSRQVNMVK
ncbi:MAG: patatin-like phospholipase family protein [Gemmataceae bacterium]|nr:patatin-like phospholipase family protein [Gemmataceae bacterium]